MCPPDAGLDARRYRRISVSRVQQGITLSVGIAAARQQPRGSRRR
jgi:hypothetical protein